jgi:hypothetical protein
MPLAEALEPLDLPFMISDALLYNKGLFAMPLQLAQACEQDDNDTITRLAEAMTVDLDQVNSVYMEAVVWAQEILRERSAKRRCKRLIQPLAARQGLFLAATSLGIIKVLPRPTPVDRGLMPVVIFGVQIATRGFNLGMAQVLTNRQQGQAGFQLMRSGAVAQPVRCRIFKIGRNLQAHISAGIIRRRLHGGLDDFMQGCRTDRTELAVNTAYQGRGFARRGQGDSPRKRR